MYSQRQSFLCFDVDCADFCCVLTQNYLTKIVRIPWRVYYKINRQIPHLLHCFPHSSKKLSYIFRRIRGMEQAIWDAVFPFHRNDF